MNHPNFNVTMLAKGRARVEIYDLLGPSMAGMIDARTVSDALKKAGELSEIELRINSKGGDAFEALAITNLLKQHPAKVNVVVDGVAASAASLVAMAGDTIRIPKNALMMVHGPRKSTIFGTEEDHRSSAETLKAVSSVVVETYSKRSKQSSETVANWMKGETWFNGTQAVEAGLADNTENELALTAVDHVASMQQMFVNPPSEFESLYALSMIAKKEPPTMAETNPAAPAATTETKPAAATVISGAPAAPQLTAADVTNAVQTALKDERKNSAAIMSICRKAGKPEMAVDFIEQGTPLADVQQKMFDVLCAARPPVGDAGGNDAPPAKDPDAPYKAEYAADLVMYQKAGISESDYIASRRVTQDHQGQVTMLPKPKAA